MKHSPLEPPPQDEELEAARLLAEALESGDASDPRLDSELFAWALWLEAESPKVRVPPNPWAKKTSPGWGRLALAAALFLGLGLGWPEPSPPPSLSPDPFQVLAQGLPPREASNPALRWARRQRRDLARSLRHRPSSSRSWVPSGTSSRKVRQRWQARTLPSSG